MRYAKTEAQGEPKAEAKTEAKPEAKAEAKPQAAACTPRWDTASLSRP